MAFSIAIPTGTYETLDHDNEVALMRPVVAQHFLHKRWFFVTEITNLVSRPLHFSKHLPVIVDSQDRGTPCGHHKAPGDLNSKLWRYIAFESYEKMLRSGGLWFNRADRFPDEYEGLLSLGNDRLRAQIYEAQHPLASAHQRLLAMLKEAKKWTYLNCWNQDQAESPFMWSNDTGFGKPEVAIQTTYGRFRRYTGSIFCATVEYLDYETDWIPEGNSLFPFFHKRKDRYWRENEFRAIVQQFPRQAVEFDQTDFYDLKQETDIDGLLLKVDLNWLIVKTVVSPKASAELLSRVMQLNEEFDVTNPVTRSELAI